MKKSRFFEYFFRFLYTEEKNLIQHFLQQIKVIFCDENGNLWKKKMYWTVSCLKYNRIYFKKEREMRKYLPDTLVPSRKNGIF